MSAASLPSTQLSLFGGKLQSLPVPAPGPGEVLVQNVAVASNPKDWKYPEWQNNHSYIEGNDIAGFVAAVGPGVTEYKGGERIAAFTKLETKENKYDAYAQYTLTPASTTIPLPDSTSFEEAATLPLAVLTAAIGLFVDLDLPEPPAPAAAPAPSSGNAIIVYGASTSVGAYAVQLAKRAGLFVVAVAGASGDYVASLGADVVADYRAHKDEAALGDALVAALAGRPIATAFDAITNGTSTLALARALAAAAPGGQAKIVLVLPLADETRARLPAGVSTFMTYVDTAHKTDEAFAARFSRQIAAYLAPGAGNPAPFRPNRVQLVPKGLAGVDEGLALLKADKVHGAKLVYRIAETPGLA